MLRDETVSEVAVRLVNLGVSPELALCRCEAVSAVTYLQGLFCTEGNLIILLGADLSHTVYDCVCTGDGRPYRWI